MPDTSQTTITAQQQPSFTPSREKSSAQLLLADMPDSHGESCADVEKQQDSTHSPDSGGEEPRLHVHDGVRDVEEARNVSDSVPVSETRKAIIVPRSKRRGLLSRITITPEVENPTHYSQSTKWFITFIISLAGAGAPFGSNVIWPALKEIAREFHTTLTIANFSVAFYMLSMSIFPLWWSALSETVGRRTTTLVSFTLFVVFSCVSALSTSITMFVIMRVLGGGASASVQAVGAGVIADLFEPQERGKAMGIFYLGPLLGPLLAPIIGGVLSQNLGWRSTMWLLAIYGAIIWLLVCFGLPETLKRKVIATSDAIDGEELTRKKSRVSMVAQKAKATTVWLRKLFVQPLSSLLYLRRPPVLLTVLYGAVTFCSLFLLNVSVQVGFSSPPYKYSASIVGLLYIPASLGFIISSVLSGRWSDYIMRREAKRAKRYDPATGKLVYLPEDRMGENAWIAASLFPAGLILFGWTIEKHLFWAVPSVGSFMFGLGSMVVFGSVTTMLTEFLPGRSSSGVAINNFVRNILSCASTVAGNPLIMKLGHGWAMTLFATITWVFGNIIIWMLKHYGPRWRQMASSS